MLKDVTRANATSEHSKRLNADDSSSPASLMNVMTGEVYPIKTNKEFIIGRAINVSLFINDVSISRFHCSIKYVNNRLVFYNLNSLSGIFLNCQKFPEDKNNITELQHGDLIGFGINKNIRHTYQVIIHTNSKKKSRLDIEYGVGAEDKYKETISKLHSNILNLKADHQVLNNKVKTGFAAIQSIMNIAELKRAWMIKVSEIYNSLMYSQKFKNEIATLEDKIILIKNKIYNQLEDEFKCSICYKLMTKVVTANCDHFFCTGCIEKLMDKSNICPACGTTIQNYANCLALENFITLINNFMGDTVKIREIIC